MNWNKGFSAAYYAYEVDPVSWREKDRIEILGGSINHESEGLRESADIECSKYDTGTEKWVRIYLDASQAGSAERIPLFTGIACTPSVSIDGYFKTETVTCFSVLKPAKDVLLPRGYYVLEGTNGAEAVKELLSVTPAPVSIDGPSSMLTQSIIAEDGETHLSMADKILKAMNLRLRISGDGNITITSQAWDISGSFDALDNDSIEPQIEIERDWFDCPNVFRAIQNEMSAVARDDDPASYLSTVNRGREIWAEESSCDLNSGESIAEYAERRLKELQTVEMTAAYDRRFDPGIQVTDLVRLNYPAQGLDGIFEVTSQKIELGFGARVSEEVRKA